MSLRDFLNKLEEGGDLGFIEEEVNPDLEITKILNERGTTVLFENVKDSGYSVVGNVCSSRGNFATALGVKENELLTRILDAVEKPR